MRRLARVVLTILHLRKLEVSLPVAGMLPVAVDNVGSDSIRIVAAEKILLHLGHAGGKSLAQLPQSAIELACADTGFVIGEIVGAGKCEVVVHHRIEFIALQIRFQLRHRINQFGRDVSLGIHFFHHLAPLFPEGMRHAKSHVEPPPIDAVGRITITVRIHPSLRCREYVIPGARHNPLLVFAEFGKCFVTKPSLVIKLFPRCGITP